MARATAIQRGFPVDRELPAGIDRVSRKAILTLIKAEGSLIIQNPVFYPTRR